MTVLPVRLDRLARNAFPQKATRADGVGAK